MSDYNPKVIHDKFGADILPDSYIIYPVSAGRSAILKAGRVVGFSRKKILVIGYDDWGGSNWARASKPSYLNYPERMVVIPADVIPAKFLAAIDKAATEYYLKEVAK